MWLKWIGAVGVVAATTAIGQMSARSVAARPRQLAALEAALQALETEIRYAATALPEAWDAVAEMAEPPLAGLFREAASRLRRCDGRTAGEVWRAALRATGGATALQPEDLAVLARLADQLGGCDWESQLQHVRLVREHLREQQRRAEESRRAQERLWSALGLLGGLAAAICLY